MLSFQLRYLYFGHLNFVYGVVQTDKTLSLYHCFQFCLESERHSRRFLVA